MTDFRIAIFDKMDQCNEESVALMLPLVSPERKAKALSYSHLPGKFACLKSYLMLKDLLEKEFNITHFTIGTGQHGKPFLKEYPDIHFNISHCKTAIAVAVSSEPIGIDIESIRKHTPALVERTMNPQESRQIMESSDPQREFIRLWTIKESVFKLSGSGITDDIREILSLSPSFRVTIEEKPDYICSISRFC